MGANALLEISHINTHPEYQKESAATDGDMNISGLVHLLQTW